MGRAAVLLLAVCALLGLAGAHVGDQGHADDVEWVPILSLADIQAASEHLLPGHALLVLFQPLDDTDGLRVQQVVSEVRSKIQFHHRMQPYHAWVIRELQPAKFMGGRGFPTLRWYHTSPPHGVDGAWARWAKHDGTDMEGGVHAMTLPASVRLWMLLQASGFTRIRYDEHWEARDHPADTLDIVLSATPWTSAGAVEQAIHSYWDARDMLDLSADQCPSPWRRIRQWVVEPNKFARADALFFPIRRPGRHPGLMPCVRAYLPASNDLPMELCKPVTPERLHHALFPIIAPGCTDDQVHAASGVPVGDDDGHKHYHPDAKASSDRVVSQRQIKRELAANATASSPLADWTVAANTLDTLTWPVTMSDKARAAAYVIVFVVTRPCAACDDVLPDLPRIVRTLAHSNAMWEMKRPLRVYVVDCADSNTLCAQTLHVTSGFPAVLLFRPTHADSGLQMDRPARPDLREARLREAALVAACHVAVPHSSVQPLRFDQYPLTPERLATWFVARTTPSLTPWDLSRLPPPPSIRVLLPSQQHADWWLPRPCLELLAERLFPLGIRLYLQATSDAQDPGSMQMLRRDRWSGMVWPPGAADQADADPASISAAPIHRRWSNHIDCLRNATECIRDVVASVEMFRRPFVLHVSSGNGGADMADVLARAEAPVLLALVHPDNVTASDSPVPRALAAVGRHLYQRVHVVQASAGDFPALARLLLRPGERYLEAVPGVTDVPFLVTSDLQLHQATLASQLPRIALMPRPGRVAVYPGERSVTSSEQIVSWIQFVLEEPERRASDVDMFPVAS